MAEERDPRDIITPAAFRVLPGLLGVRLAGPWRRGLAFLALWGGQTPGKRLLGIRVVRLVGGLRALR